MRDAVDRRVVEEIRTGTATLEESYKGGGKGIIDSQKDGGGWPELRSVCWKSPGRRARAKSTSPPIRPHGSKTSVTGFGSCRLPLASHGVRLNLIGRTKIPPNGSSAPPRSSTSSR